MKKAFSKEKWRYMFYTLRHPMEGFYWIRHQERGSVPLAILMVFIFSVCFTGNRLLAAFTVNELDPKNIDSIFELLGVFSFYILICASNWGVTCLMNGEGRLKDIAIAIGYGTVPISIILFVATIVSYAVADNEQAIYKLFVVVGIIYGLIIMIIGIMQVHNYTFGKTFATLILTFIAMLIIIFLVLLLSNLIGAVINFIRSVYTEIIFGI